MSDLPRHKFWGAGEPDCPPDLKASNGELHTMRCKVCGDGWRKSRDVCLAARAPMPVERIAMLWNSLPLETDPQSVIAFARAIERFHGIQGSADPESAVVGAAKEAPANPHPAGSEEAEAWDCGYYNKRVRRDGLGAHLGKVWREGWDARGSGVPVPLPHPALDRANAGERESEGSQKQENARG